MQSEKWGLSPSLGLAFLSRGYATGWGAEPRCRGQPPCSSSMPPQKVAGAQTYVDMLRPYKGTKEHGWRYEGARRGSTALPNTGRDLHATWMGTRVGTEELGAPGGPRWSPIRKKHLQTLSGCEAAKPSTPRRFELGRNGPRGSRANKRRAHQARVVVYEGKGSRLIQWPWLGEGHSHGMEQQLDWPYSPRSLRVPKHEVQLVPSPQKIWGIYSTL